MFEVIPDGLSIVESSESSSGVEMLMLTTSLGACLDLGLRLISFLYTRACEGGRTHHSSLIECTLVSSLLRVNTLLIA